MLVKADFVNLMMSMGEVFDKQVTEAQLDIYYEIFKDFSFEQIKKAFYSCLRTHRYNTLPKPADILSFLEGTQDDRALMAWLEVKEAVIKAGYYQTVEFRDPIISHCLEELGGWMAFCSCQKDELPFIEKRFMDLYRLFEKRGTSLPVKLVGFIEVRNRELSQLEHIPKSVKIGFDKINTLESKPKPISSNKKVAELIGKTV